MNVIIFWILASYGFTSILVWGAIFDTPRTWISSKCKFLGELLSCTLCTGTWVGFFMSALFYVFGSSGLCGHVFNDIPWYIGIFDDGMFTAGSVWALNSVIEFFEESRITNNDKNE